MIFKSSHGNIYYELSGKKEAKTIVFTHGVAMDHRSFSAQAEHFSKNYQVLVWDMPGHGKSFSCDKEFNYKMVSKVLNELLDYLGIEKIVHTGVSLGGHIGQYYAFHYPERVEKLIDIGSSPLHKPFKKINSWFIKIALYFSYLIPENLFNKMFAKDKAIKKTTQDYLYETATHTTKIRTLKITFAFMNALKEGLKQPVKQPLFIVMGENDLKPLRKGAKKWSEELNLPYEIIKDAGHIAHQDNPAIFNKLMEAFIKK